MYIIPISMDVIMKLKFEINEKLYLVWNIFELPSCLNAWLHDPYSNLKLIA